MTRMKGGLVRRLTITAFIAIACLIGPTAWAQTGKPSPTAKKAKAPGSVQKAKAPPARPPANRAVTGEVTLV